MKFQVKEVRLETAKENENLGANVEGQKLSAIINEILDIAEENLVLYKNMLGDYSFALLEDGEFDRAKTISTTAKAGMYRALRSVGVDHEQTIRAIDMSVIDNTTLRAQLKSSITF